MRRKSSYRSRTIFSTHRELEIFYWTPIIVIALSGNGFQNWSAKVQRETGHLRHLKFYPPNILLITEEKKVERPGRYNNGQKRPFSPHGIHINF